MLFWELVPPEEDDWLTETTVAEVVAVILLIPVILPAKLGVSIKTMPRIIPPIVPNIPGRFFCPNGLFIPTKPSVIRMAPIACSAAAYEAGPFALYNSRKFMALCFKLEKIFMFLLLKFKKLFILYHLSLACLHNMMPTID